MDDTFRQALSDVKLAFDLFRESIGLFRSAKDLLPDSDEKKAASKALEEAELKSKLAEASLAKSLGFILCPKCWPPSVITAIKVYRQLEIYRCPSCSTEYLNHGKRNNIVRLEERASKSVETPDQ